MPVPSQPEYGDVIARKDKCRGKWVYVLHTVGGADAYLLVSRDDAVAQATKFAKGRDVHAWLLDEEPGCVLLEDSRQ